MPTAFLPWRFLGAARQGSAVRLFALDALSGRLSGESSVPVLEPRFEEALEPVQEFRAMRELSPLFLPVAAEADGGGEVVTCRDLRTRNFQTRFGELKVRFGPDRRPRRVEWEV